MKGKRTRMKGLVFTAAFVVVLHYCNAKDKQSLVDSSFGPVSKDVSLLSDQYEAELGRYERDADKEDKLPKSKNTPKQKSKPKQPPKQRRAKKRKGKIIKKKKDKKKKKGKKKKGSKNKREKKKKGKKKKNRQNNVVEEKKPHEGPYGYMHPEEIDVGVFLNLGTFSLTNL